MSLLNKEQFSPTHEQPMVKPEHKKPAEFVEHKHESHSHPSIEGEVPAFHKNSRLKRAQVALPKSRDEMTLRVEKILEENVGDAYSRLSPIAKQEFKLKGEETAEKISRLLKNTHVKVKKVFKLILDWLRMLPGINRFFLEQEAKIKTDRIVSLHKKHD